MLKKQPRDRFNIVLGREVDTQGIGYNIGRGDLHRSMDVYIAKLRKYLREDASRIAKQ